MTAARTTRRRFLAGLGALGLVGACGGEDRESDANSGSGERDDASGADPRTVTTDNGPVEVPSDPQRVVAAIGSFETDMVAVGVMPVMTTTFAGPWVDLDGKVTITKNIPPSLEELARARPDLIVGWNWVTQEPIYDELVQLAPYVGLGESATTVGPGFSSNRYESWDTLFLAVADAVGRRAEGARLLADFERRLDDLASHRSDAPELSVARVEFYETGSFSYRGQNEDTAILMQRLGLTVVGPEETVNKESLERLPQIAADLIIVPVGGGLPKAVFEAITQLPLWQAVPAVRAGHVEVVDGELWPGLGYLWATALVDDLERLFVES